MLSKYFSLFFLKGKKYRFYNLASKKAEKGEKEGSGIPTAVMSEVKKLFFSCSCGDAMPRDTFCTIEKRILPCYVCPALSKTNCKATV